MPTYNLSLCGLEISFNTSADAERVEKASEFVQKSYDALQFHGSQLGRDRLLAILALGIADDLLQLQQQNTITTENAQLSHEQVEQIEQRLSSLLLQINTTVRDDSLYEESTFSTIDANMID